ncbi:hypothetical protein BC941DRAFT_417907 [Chlamydoabsidia padenii]|nr:hypothetical protein BC941DRAFT_417907 [Chlamydoabsidia padenii]
MHGTHTESTSGNKPTCAITIQNSETKDQQTIMSSWRTWWRLVPRLALVVVVGALCFYTLIQLAHILLNMQVPHTIQQVQSIAVQLDDMTHHGTWSDYFAVVVVFAAIYLWQQAFSMPGSVLFNLLAGQLYGVVVASIWTSYLTALGSLLAYFLGRWVIGPSVLDVPCVKRRVGLWEEQMDQERKSIGLFWWLLFIRLLPFSPYW